MEKEKSPESGKREDVVLPNGVGEETAQTEDLPTGKVQYFPANPKQVLLRRVITVLVTAACVTGLVFILREERINYALLILIISALLVCVFVFAQSFLISGYRVAIDYDNKAVILRYMFRKLSIPFLEFDCREGEPDEAQKAIRKIRAGSPQRMYLILDNVHDDSCYQTSSYDLASNADFMKLKEEAEQIARAYKAREHFEEEQRALKAMEEELAKEALTDVDIQKIVEEGAQADSEGTDPSEPSKKEE
ncbi:MAG: hypothetical protein GXY43_05795 [Clostridiaceae bacterium]|nr:hypothetical protein [Clostridiaceae bacterium]